MGEKMTYKQAFNSSVIVGVIFTNCIILLMVVGKTNSALNNILIMVLNGVDVFLGSCHIKIIDKDLSKAITYFSPIIVCLLLGSILFLILKEKPWFTIRKFTFILLGMYIAVNVMLSSIAILILLIQTYQRLKII